MPPRNKLCVSGEPPGPMNCGRKAAKNSAVLGLSKATRKPSRNALSREVGPSGAAEYALEPEIRARIPRSTRYEAPASLTMRKAVDDAAKTTASPREAIEALLKLPSATPPSDERPML